MPFLPSPLLIKLLFFSECRLPKKEMLPTKHAGLMFFPAVQNLPALLLNFCRDSALPIGAAHKKIWLRYNRLVFFFQRALFYSACAVRSTSLFRSHLPAQSSLHDESALPLFRKF